MNEILQYNGQDLYEHFKMTILNDIHQNIFHE